MQIKNHSEIQFQQSEKKVKKTGNNVAALWLDLRPLHRREPRPGIVAWSTVSDSSVSQAMEGNRLLLFY